MQCPRCGSDVQQGLQFCTQCGNNFPGDMGPHHFSAAAIHALPQRPPAAGGKASLIGFGLMLLALIGFAFCIGYAVRPAKKETDVGRLLTLTEPQVVASFPADALFFKFAADDNPDQPGFRAREYETPSGERLRFTFNGNGRLHSLSLTHLVSAGVPVERSGELLKRLGFDPGREADTETGVCYRWKDADGWDVTTVVGDAGGVQVVTFDRVPFYEDFPGTNVPLDIGTPPPPVVEPSPPPQAFMMRTRAGGDQPPQFDPKTETLRQ